MFSFTFIRFIVVVRRRRSRRLWRFRHRISYNVRRTPTKKNDQPNTTMLYLYDARYPDDYDKPHVVFRKYNFQYEYDSSDKRKGLPGICNPSLLISFPVVPCILPNTIIPIRDCSYIGYSKAFEWPRVHYDIVPHTRFTDLPTILQMYGTSFVACKPSADEFHYPVVPNIDVYEGLNSVSATGCLKLHFDGYVEPIWLGNAINKENVDVYLERLPGRRKRQ